MPSFSLAHLVWPQGLALLAVVAPTLANAHSSATPTLTASDTSEAFAKAFARGLRHFQNREFHAAQKDLEEALRYASTDPDVLLPLGIAYFRTGTYVKAERVLKQVAKDPSAEIRATARLFLGLVYQELGAIDQARGEIQLASQEAPGLNKASRSILSRSQPKRLMGTLVISPEYDGNVPLTPRETWISDPQASMDGPLLFSGTLSGRPLRSVGLLLSDTLSYRRQFRTSLQEYSLLVNSLTLGYSYLSERHRIRTGLSFNYAHLYDQTLYVDGSLRAAYRLRLSGHWGLGLAYDGRYRKYFKLNFDGFTGYTSAFQFDLSYATTPEPVLFNLGYQVVREDLMPFTYTDGENREVTDNYSAWAHGPSLRLRAALSRRVELSLFSALLQRLFYVAKASQDPTSLRRDVYFFGDASVTVECTSYLDVFAGITVLVNESAKNPEFTYVKPTSYVGISASFAAF